MKKKRKISEFEEAPKLSAKKLIADNWFLIKLVFSASPAAVFLYALEQFRVQAFIFLEHTWMIQTVLDCVQYQKPFEDALLPILFIAGLLLVTSIMGSLTGQWLTPKAKLKAQTKIKNMLFDKAHEVDLKYFDDPKYYNDFIMTTEKTSALVEYVFNIIYIIASSVATAVTTGVYFALVSPASFLIVAVSAAINLVILLQRGKYNYSKFAVSQRYERKTGYVKRLFYLQDYAKELRLNPEAAKRALEDFDRACDSICRTYDEHNKRIMRLQRLKYIAEETLFGLILVLYLAYRASVLEAISYATMIVMMNSVWSLRYSFTAIITHLASSAENCMFVEKIRSFLSRSAEIVTTEGLAPSEEPCSLELKNVSFAYSENDGKVVDNVSLKLHPKEKIALVGYNGAGKTTLIKLLLRLYDPTDGEIYMDGKNIKSYDVEAYRHNIGVVFQDFNLYAASVKENVVMGPLEGADDEKVLWALRHSGFEERLSKLGDGLDTQLTCEFDDDGVNLSGGESQKIAISRAFYKNSGLIILDEPSGALDPIAEYNFNRYMSEAAKDCTVVFISHRLSTTRLADRIVVMENGRICEEGTHEELLSSEGKYYEMWHTQADKYLYD